MRTFDRTPANGSSRAGTSPAPRRRLLALSAVGVALALGGAAYLQATAGSDTGRATTGALPPADFPEPGIAHVHGLGVDPADGALYAATHFGLFRLPEDGSEATRVANRYQDTMGFTVVGLAPSSAPDTRTSARTSLRGWV